MFKTLEKWMDMAVLVVLLAVSAVSVMVTVPLITGDVTNVGQDKAAISALKVEYDPVQYTVGDLLLAAIRVDRSYPIDSMTVVCRAKAHTFDIHDEKYLTNTYALAYDIMLLKPSNMSEQDFYSMPISFEMDIDSTKNEYNYTIEIGG